MLTIKYLERMQRKSYYLSYLSVIKLQNLSIFNNSVNNFDPDKSIIKVMKLILISVYLFYTLFIDRGKKFQTYS